MTTPNGCKEVPKWTPESCKLDDLSLYKLYAFTVNAADKFQYAGMPAMERAMKCKKHYVSILEATKSYLMRYYFVPEISIPEANTMPRYHLHGIIYFRDDDDILFWLLEMQTILSGNHSYNIKPVHDIDEWLTYCHKQNRLGRIHNFVLDPVPMLRYVFEHGKEPETEAPARETKRTKKKVRKEVTKIKI